MALTDTAAQLPSDLEDWKQAVAHGETLLGYQEWVQQQHEKAHGMFPEPEACEQCASENEMSFDKVSINGKDGIPAWICYDCGHAYLNPDHDAEDCAGC